MSAFKYLVFVLGTILVAIYGAIMLEIIRPAITQMNAHSSTAASSTGIDWFASFVEFLPLVLLALLAFALIVSIVVRRQSTTRI